MNEEKRHRKIRKGGGVEMQGYKEKGSPRIKLVRAS